MRLIGSNLKLCVPISVPDLGNTPDLGNSPDIRNSPEIGNVPDMGTLQNFVTLEIYFNTINPLIHPIYSDYKTLWLILGYPLR